MELSSNDIIPLFWGHQPGTHRFINGDVASKDTAIYRPYLDYFQIQLSYCHFRAEDFVILKYMVLAIKTDECRHDIVAALKTSKSPLGSSLYAPVDSVDRLVNLAARLLVLCNFGPVLDEANPRQHLAWPLGTPLRHTISRYFDNPPMLQDRVRLPKAFDAWALENVAGITIQFTDNLLDHLRLLNDDTTLLVFHHASFLEMQAQNSLFPEDVPKETLRTLALLFPQAQFSAPRRSGSKYKQDWFKKLCLSHTRESRCQVDGRIVRCGTLQSESRQIEKFFVWRDRLIVLKQAYDDATPSTLKQWWHDRRHGPQWFTFWVAVLVFVVTTFLGVIQCIEGGLQAYKSFY